MRPIRRVEVVGGPSISSGSPRSEGFDALSTGSLPPALARAIVRTRNWLVDHQHPDGHWCAELEGDSILQSEYILLKWIIQQEHDPRLPWVANYLRSRAIEKPRWLKGSGM